jgi:hypothetical protein
LGSGTSPSRLLRYDAPMPDEYLDRPNKLLAPTPPQNGPIVGTLIVIIIMILGALFIAGEHLRKERVARGAPAAQSATTTIFIKIPATSSKQLAN